MSPRITIVGGGSYQWAPKLLVDLANTPALHGAQVVIQDIDPAPIPRMVELLRRGGRAPGGTLHAPRLRTSGRALRGRSPVPPGGGGESARLAGGCEAGDNGCVPRPERLTDDQVTQALAGLPGWARDRDAIVKTFELPTFLTAIAVVGQIAERAEAADHHPDLDIRYRRLRVALSTHDAGGLTELDVSLAGEIEALAGAAGAAGAAE